MNTQELRVKKVSELREELGSLLKEQFTQRMHKGTGQLVKPHDLRRLRRDIARVRTILNEKSKEANAA